MAAVPAIGRASRVEQPLGEASHAAQALYERHYRRILGFCQYQLGTRHEAEDAAQTTFMHALGALQRGVVPVREVPWLLTIARNVCRTRWDAGRRRGRIEFNGDPHVIEETAAADAEPEWTLLGLEEALAELPEQQRQAILLREWQGLSYHEIAEVLGVSVSAVETSIFRARRGLAKKLGDENGRRLGLGSLLTAFKSALFGGGGAAVKLAATAAVLIAGTGAAVTTVTLRHDAAPPPAVSDAVPASDAAVSLPTVLSRVAPVPAASRASRPAAPVKTPAVRSPRPKTRTATSKATAPAATPTARTAATEPSAAPPAATPTPAETHSTPAPVQRAKTTQPPAKSTKPVQDVVEQVTQPVVQTVVEVAKPVLDTVNTVVPPVVLTVTDAAQPVVNTVTNVTQPVVTTVTTVVAPVLPPPPAQAPSPPPQLPQLPLLPGHP